MATVTVNGIELFYELSGTSEIPLVLVHGSWVSHHSWDLVVPGLAESCRVLTYDRRGHSESERPIAQGSVREDVADLGALIEELGLAPAWVVGNSFGGSIALRLAGERPALFRGLIVHEPPLFSLLADDPTWATMLTEAEERVSAVVERMASGDHAGAAEQFVETVALGPGTWAQLPPDFQQTTIENAPTFLDESNDPEQLVFDLEWIKGFSRPSMLTMGDQSPPAFAPVVAKLADVLANVETVTFPGGGHVPHLTHPEAYVDAIKTFIGKNATGSSNARGGN
jgi:pimeloyl-ACP methyl ester carboxylesterase